MTAPNDDKQQPPPPPPEEQSTGGEADLAQAYRDLARGEQAASAMEANLTNLESKLDAILAAMEDAEGKADQGSQQEGGAEKGKGSS